MNELVMLDMQSENLGKEISKLRQSMKNAEPTQKREINIKLERKVKQFKKLIDTIHANDNY